MKLFDRIKRAFTGEDPTLEQIQQKETDRIQLDQYTTGMEKTRKSFSEKMNELFADFNAVDDVFFDELEEAFITSDVGFEMTLAIVDALREDDTLLKARTSQQAKEAIIKRMVDIYEQGDTGISHLRQNSDGPSVYLFVGVNGVGKTTSIAKIAHRLKKEGKSVMLVAGDTFRAGAIEQLEIWGERVGAPVVKTAEGGDPAAVVFDALKQAKDQAIDYVLVDTAGRLQNKVNLMKELEKINRIITRQMGHEADEVLLVLDATTGQNALVQAKQFSETVRITGLILTKLDGTARGGVILSIRHEMSLPVKFVGLGESFDDLQVFDPAKYIYGLIKDVIQQ